MRQVDAEKTDDFEIEGTGSRNWRDMTLGELDVLGRLPESAMSAAAEEFYRWSSEDRPDWMLTAVFSAMIHALAMLETPVPRSEQIASHLSPNDSP